MDLIRTSPHDASPNDVFLHKAFRKNRLAIILQQGEEVQLRQSTGHLHSVQTVSSVLRLSSQGTN